MRIRSSSWLPLLSLVLWVVPTARAHAAGYLSLGFGGELGHVVAANPTAIAYNPGAIGFSGTQLMLDVALAVRHTTWEHAAAPTDVPPPAGYESANYGTASSSLVRGGPQMAGTLALGEHLVLAAGWYVPWGGGSLTFDSNPQFANTPYPGAVDGVQRWHGYEATLRIIYATAGAALRFGRFSIGVTANAVVADLGVKRAQNTSGAGGNDITREQRVEVETSKITGSIGVGVMGEVIPKLLWLGASYQSQPGFGELAMDGTYTLDATINVDDATRSQEISMHQALPDIVRAGGRLTLGPAVELRLTGAFTRWSVNQTQCASLRDQPCTVYADGSPAKGSGVIKNIPRRWQDTIAVAAGVSVWPIKPLETFVGVGFENAAIPEEMLDPLAADADMLNGAIGFRLRVFDSWLFALSYNHRYFFPRDNRGRSNLANPDIHAVSRAVDGGGIYRQWFATANLNIAKQF